MSVYDLSVGYVSVSSISKTMSNLTKFSVRVPVAVHGLDVLPVCV